jgi:hypothetical protein
LRTSHASWRASILIPPPRGLGTTGAVSSGDHSLRGSTRRNEVIRHANKHAITVSRGRLATSTGRGKIGTGLPNRPIPRPIASGRPIAPSIEEGLKNYHAGRGEAAGRLIFSRAMGRTGGIATSWGFEAIITWVAKIIQVPATPSARRQAIGRPTPPSLAVGRWGTRDPFRVFARKFAKNESKGSADGGPTASACLQWAKLVRRWLS